MRRIRESGARCGMLVAAAPNRCEPHHPSTSLLTGVACCTCGRRRADDALDVDHNHTTRNAGDGDRRLRGWGLPPARRTVECQGAGGSAARGAIERGQAGTDERKLVFRPPARGRTSAGKRNRCRSSERQTSWFGRRCTRDRVRLTVKARALGAGFGGVIRRKQRSGNDSAHVVANRRGSWRKSCGSAGRIGRPKKVDAKAWVISARRHIDL
jgi:hypothetical protein